MMNQEIYTMTQGLTPAPLDNDTLNKLQTLEAETGTVIVAYKPQPRFARLTDDQVKQVEALEQELGVVLLAYKDGPKSV
jgi:hypothetical protein